MKKILAVLLTLAMLFCLTACGKNNDDNSDTVSPDTTASRPEQTSGEETEPDTHAPVHTGNITLDDVLNAPESPESDFEFSSYGDDIVEVSKYLGDDEIVVIPETWDGRPVTRIGAYVFANDYHPNTKAIRLPDSVKSIETFAFGANKSLEIFVAGSGLGEIGQAAFQSCTGLHTVVLNEGLVTLRSLAFASCQKLMSLEIPSSVTEIEPAILAYCDSTFVLIGEAGSTIEEYAATEGITFEAK